MTETRSGLTGEDLYATIRRDLIDHRAPAGSLLQENEIAERYGVSRTPVREALQRLHQEQLIGRRGRFYVVYQPSIERIREIFEFREAIESATTVLCCRRASDDDIAQISNILHQQERCAVEQRYYEFERLDGLFHVTIATFAQNALLKHQLEISYDQIWFSRVGNLVSIPTYSTDATLAGHQRILGALLRRDEDVARAEMISHLRSAITLGERSLPLPRKRRGGAPLKN